MAKRIFEILLVVLVGSGCAIVPTTKYIDKNNCKVIQPQGGSLSNGVTEALIQCGNVCCWAFGTYKDDHSVYADGKYYSWVCDGKNIPFQSCTPQKAK